MFKSLLSVSLFVSVLSSAVPSLPQERAKLRVSVPTKTVGFTALWVASKMGFFERQGLDVDLIVIRSSDVGIQALAGGSLEISGSTADAVVTAADKGLDLMMIGGISNGLSQSIMGAPKFKTYNDLRGATLGAISLTSGVTFVLKHVLKVRGLEYPRDYKLLVIGGSPQLYTALTTGQIDAAALSLPFNYAAEELGFTDVGRFVDVIPNFQLAVLSVKRSWAEKNRMVLVRFMRSMAQAYGWIYKNKDSAIDFLAREMKLNREHARRGWEFYTAKSIWPIDGDINIDGLQVVLQIYTDQTRAKGAVPSATKYVDKSYLRDALSGPLTIDAGKKAFK